MEAYKASQVLPLQYKLQTSMEEEEEEEMDKKYIKK